MSELPTQIAIGPFVYRVTDDRAAFAQLVVEDMHSTWGYIRYGEERIILNPNQSAGHMRLALLHECLHGCWHLTDREHDDDEKAVLTLAAALLDMLRRNPDLVAYLTNEESA